MRAVRTDHHVTLITRHPPQTGRRRIEDATEHPAERALAGAALADEQENRIGATRQT
jgi:hypothetical protein